MGVCAPQRRISIPRFFGSRALNLLWLLLLAFALPAPAAAPSPVTTYARMTAQLRADAARSSWVRLVSLGKSATGRRQIWLVRLTDPQADPKQAVRLLVLCRQHGDEPASTEALLHLIHSAAFGGDPALHSALSHVTLYVVPMVNPDGADAGTRVNGVGADLNRDWGVFAQPETRAVAAAAKCIRPALVVDAHNWDGNDEYNADCIEIPREMETPSGRAAHALQQQAVRDLALCGYAVHPTAWGADSNPHLAHRWFVHSQTPSLLVETHSGSPADRADFERREGMYVALVHSLIRHASAPWLHQANQGDTQEAALFPPLAPPAASLPAVARLKPPCRWLWPLAAYALALWAVSLRAREFAVPAAGRVRHAVRYSYSRKSYSRTQGKPRLPEPAARHGQVKRNHSKRNHSKRNHSKSNLDRRKFSQV